MAEVENVPAQTENAEMSDEQLDTALQDSPELVDAKEPATEVEEEKPAAEKLVRLEALHEERIKRKNAETAMRQERAERERIQSEWQRGQQRLEALAQAAWRQQQPQAPDPSQDPFGAQSYQIEQIGSRVENLTQKLERESQERAQQEHAARFVNHVQSQVHAFAQQTPDYFDAYNFAKSSRVKEYIAAGYPEDQAQQLFARDELTIGQEALQRGENPAEVAYRIAQARGYVPAKAKLEMQQKGQAASKPAGGNTAGKLSLEALANMDSDEFDAMVGDPKAWKKLMGG